MKKYLLNKYTICFFCIAFLLSLLYISINYTKIDLFNNFRLYAAKQEESSTSTKEEATGEEMVELLARLINGEARGEPYEGQVAVGAVILNRVKSSQFPNTIAGVIYQAGAFTAVADGQINVPIDENSTVYKAARDAMNGWDPTGGCIYYFNPNTATNKWIWSRPYVKTIGKHRFCK